MENEDKKEVKEAPLAEVKKEPAPAPAPKKAEKAEPKKEAKPAPAPKAKVSPPPRFVKHKSVIKYLK